MKIARSLLALCFVVSLIAPSFANQPPTATDSNGVVPTQFYSTPSFLGLLHCTISESSSASYGSCTSGAPGVLYAICPSNVTLATTTNYTVVYDTLSTYNGQYSVNSRSNLITPAVYATIISLSTNNNVALQAGGSAGCWVPPYPVQFNNGLQVQQSAGTFNTVLYYRTNPTVNSVNQ